MADILLQKLEARFVRQMFEVLHAAGQQIVGTNHGVPFRQQGVAQMRAQKSRSASDQHPHTRLVSLREKLTLWPNVARCVGYHSVRRTRSV